MAKIVKVRKATWAQNYESRFKYDVFYESGRQVSYNWRQCLPITVVDFLMRNDIDYKVEYKEAFNKGIGTIKWERFTIKNDEAK